MFINGPRNEQAIKSELDTVEEYCQRTFGIAVDFPAFEAQVREIIQSRIQDYIFQRFRDWPIRDLLSLEYAIGERVDLASTDEIRKRGRPRKSVAQG
jgi:hypothetical protein